eukprot:COSAG05_NODE_13879_length_415_cov_0.971519_1_plen_31_part_01
MFCELFVHWDAFWLEAAPASVMEFARIAEEF